jgi:hypothetical protein
MLAMADTGTTAKNAHNDLKLLFMLPPSIPCRRALVGRLKHPGNAD